MKTVCLLTAGTGTRMGSYATVMNKTLLPVNNKAIISHIIEQFPLDTKFVVALGFMGETVRSYLKLAHPSNTFTFVEVDNFNREGAGPAYSLRCCKPELPGPFMLITCDGLYKDLANFPDDGNYIGVSKVEGSNAAYCNIKVADQFKVVSAIFDKQECDAPFSANGVFFFRTVDSFWTKLNGSELSSGFKDLYLTAHEGEWTDLGTFEKYRSYFLGDSPYDFSKVDEFLYIINGRVIKWFKDGKITANRVAKSKLKPSFPIVDKIDGNFYSYKLVPGHTLYEKINAEIFSGLIKNLRLGFWKDIPSKNLTKEMMLAFYRDKTVQRLEMFKQKYPDFHPKSVNSSPMNLSIEEALLQGLDWESIVEFNLRHRSRFIHGDLQFDNIIYDGNSFTYIDWRQDFSGEIEVGDLFYDVAKMMGGMIINYDLIKKNIFYFEENGDSAFYDVPRRKSADDFSRQLMGYFSPKSRDVIDQIITLIFLNMAPLHNAPFDKLLYCIALERLNRRVESLLSQTNIV